MGGKILSSTDLRGFKNEAISKFLWRRSIEYTSRRRNYEIDHFWASLRASPFFGHLLCCSSLTIDSIVSILDALNLTKERIAQTILERILPPPSQNSVELVGILQYSFAFITIFSQKLNRNWPGSYFAEVSIINSLKQKIKNRKCCFLREDHLHQ